MKQRAHCAWFYILFLTLGVAARETPEILELIDDWSNDGVAVGYKDPTPRLAKRALTPRELARSVVVRPLPIGNVTKKYFWFGPSLDASSKAGPDLLRLLSIIRS